MINVYQKYRIKNTFKVRGNIFILCILWIGLYLFVLPAFAQDKTVSIEGSPLTSQGTNNNPLPDNQAQVSNEPFTKNKPDNKKVVSSYFSTTEKMTQPQKSIGISDFITSFVFLSAIVALIFILAWFFKRTGLSPNSGNQVIKIISAVALSHKEKIALIEVGNQQVLIGVSPGNIQKLLVLDTPVKMDEKSMGSVSSPFSSQLFKYISKEKNAN